MTDEVILDCQALVCPQPVIRTKDALANMAVGARLLVIVDNEAALSNVCRFVESRGHAVRAEDQGGGVHHLAIRKDVKASAAETSAVVCEPSGPQPLVIYIASEVMGRGDDDLGRVLMGMYFETLSHFARDISHIIFVNSGVKLAVAGSPALEELQSLEKMGVKVLSCGTCLNHFGVKEELKVGVLSNMFTILEVLAKAGKTLSP
ncbi:MAG: sulfurtransferase-like selenium metabolism protein YedF [Desulfobulbaceae bacterium]|nr:MAG: sulfurtransferase-like selenium metabolism protein YedF [Desulfobulbaceae bacterium]